MSLDVEGLNALERIADAQERQAETLEALLADESTVGRDLPADTDGGRTGGGRLRDGEGSITGEELDELLDGDGVIDADLPVDTDRDPDEWAVTSELRDHDHVDSVDPGVGDGGQPYLIVHANPSVRKTTRIGFVARDHGFVLTDVSAATDDGHWRLVFLVGEVVC